MDDCDKLMIKNISQFLFKELIEAYEIISRELRGYTGFETLKNLFFMIFYIIVQHVKNIFPKFQVNRSKILGERDF